MTTTSRQFRKFDHVERLGHPEVRDLTIGLVHVFPKLDGTNGAVWLDDLGNVQCSSRNRVLSLEQDNHGFCEWIHGDDPKAVGLREYCRQNPDDVVYGEWMIPHTLKTYRAEVWNHFWIFDIFDRVKGRYESWEDYGENLQFQELDVIEPICTIQNPGDEQLQMQVETNTYLIADGAGLGEGVVVKNYLWENVHGRQPWAKIVRNEFKERNKRAFGVTHKEGARVVEAEIAACYCTPAFVGKTRAKVVAEVANEKGIDLVANPNAQSDIEHEYRHKVIPQLLGRAFHDLVVEESWTFVKKWKNPTINFKLLQSHVIAKVKEFARDMF